MSQGTYHSYVQSLSSRWRHLEHLNNFMKENSYGRISRPRIAVLDFGDDSTVDSHVVDVFGLPTILDQSSTIKGGRLFLVQKLNFELP